MSHTLPLIKVEPENELGFKEVPKTEINPEEDGHPLIIVALLEQTLRLQNLERIDGLNGTRMEGKSKRELERIEKRFPKEITKYAQFWVAKSRLFSRKKHAHEAIGILEEGCRAGAEPKSLLDEENTNIRALLGFTPDRRERPRSPRLLQEIYSQNALESQVIAHEAKVDKLAGVESVGLVELPASRHNRGTGVVMACGNVIIPGIGQVIDVAAGGLHSVILTTDGGVYTFGNNDEGALGRPTEEEDRFEARKVLLPGRVCMISAGDAHSAALLQDGLVFAWGIFKSASGDLGLIPTCSAKVESPVAILPSVHIKKISSGENHMVLLSETGHVYTFGCPEQGQLGRFSSRTATIGSRTLTVDRYLEPQNIALMIMKRTDKPRRKEVALFDDVWAGGKATYLKIKSSDQIYVCGLNYYNRKATESAAIQYFPILSSLSERAIALGAAQHHILAISLNVESVGLVELPASRHNRGTGVVLACGNVIIPGIGQVIDVAVGGLHSVILTTDGELHVVIWV